MLTLSSSSLGFIIKDDRPRGDVLAARWTISEIKLMVFPSATEQFTDPVVGSEVVVTAGRPR